MLRAHIGRKSIFLINWQLLNSVWYNRGSSTHRRYQDMELIEVHVSKLKGRALDWAVSMAVHGVHLQAWEPSSDWAHGGRLFDDYDIRITDPTPNNLAPNGEKIRAVSVHRPIGHTAMYAPSFNGGPTLLQAACRALVAEKLGAVVQVPAALVEQSA